MKKLPILLCISLIITSCAPVIKVFHKDNSKKGRSKVKGIPFYTQKGIIKQETHYLFTYKEVTFTERTIEAKPKETRLANRRVDASTDFTTILQKVDMLDEVPLAKRTLLKTDIIDLVNQMQKKEINKLTSTDVTPVGNFWKFDSYIDYSNPYYINGSMPWFGTASLTQKINDKGTLSEVSATTDSQIDDLIGTLSGLASPISNVKIAKISAEDQEDEDQNSVDKMWELKIIEKGFLYTFFKTVCNGTCAEYGQQKKFTPIEFDLDGHFKRINYPVSAAKPKEEDKSAIKVNGSIVLPKKK